MLSQIKQLSEIKELVRRLQATDDPDELGRIDKIIRDLSLIRKTSLAELSGPVTGSAYRVTEQRKAKRSYNTAAILVAFGKKDLPLMALVHGDAVRLTWQWTKLRQMMHAADVDLVLTSREVENLGDADAPMIGEVWTSYYKIEGVQE